MNKQDRRQRGYTLAEVLVALAIFAIIFLAALTAYDRSNRVFRTGVESSNMQQNTRVAFDKLVGDLRMAGYDFDRDGIPTVSGASGFNVFQQPDEQFEYIGPAALTIRGNFDYESENQPCKPPTVTDNCDNGTEPTYEDAQFPVVTTGNDEIVTYALVHDPPPPVVPTTCNPNVDCVELYADTHIPRKSYPDVPNGGLDENLVQITGVDLCMNGCNNPPYTLYRFTLDRSQQSFPAANTANITRTPLASNIRSIQFTYYQDAQGVDPLKDLANTVDVSTGATILGKGQYKVGSPLTLVAERDIRAKINSIRVTLIGMNESRDAAFTDTAETVTGSPGYFEQYRKYRLETLVSPRNVQKRGMREQDTAEPGPPTIDYICTGACAGVYVSWTAPAVNASQGAPDQYKVIFDVAGPGGFNCETTTFTNTFSHVFYQPGTMPPSCKMIPNQPYKFAVVALNSYGSATSATKVATPLNATKPAAPVLQSTTTNQNGRVTLTWLRPTTNASGGYSCSPTGSQAVPSPAELQGYIVERRDPVTGAWLALPSLVPIDQLTSPSQVTMSSMSDTVTWADTKAVNCVDYDYRVTAVEACYFNPNYNNPTTAATCGGGPNCGAMGISDASNQVPGHATTTITPAAPSNLIIDQGAPTTCSPAPPPSTGDICDVHMHFPPVTLDTATPTANPITINQYTVWRKEVGSAAAPVTFTISNPTLNAVGEIEFTNVGVPVAVGQIYNYWITAHSQCPVPTGTDSGPSPTRPYPCVFPVGLTGPGPLIMVSAFDGDGSFANPYKIATGTNAVADINILPAMAASIQKVVGRAYIGTTLKWQEQCPGGIYCSSPNPPWTFSWALTANATERFDVAIVESGGCVTQASAYFEDEPQNCCLTPSTFDPSVINFSSGNAFVDIILKNVCGQDLTIDGLTVTWSSANTPGGTKLDRIWFPVPSGGCGSPGFVGSCQDFQFGGGGAGPGTSTLTAANIPAGTKSVLAGQQNYKIRVQFTKSLTNPNQPITGFSVHYTNATTGLLGTSCAVK